MEEKKYGLRDFVGNVKSNGVARALGKDISETFNMYEPSYDINNETPRQAIGSAVIGIGALALIGTLFASPFVIYNKIDQAARRAQEPVLWEEYSGNIPGYKVEISDSRERNGSSISIIHLTATDSSIVPNGITGHSNGIDGQVERVFIMNKKFDSCDSVSFDDGRIKWEPSPSSKDEGKKPFTSQQILHAQKEIYEALDSIGNDAHKTRHWVPGMSKEDNYGLIKREN